MLLGSMMVHIFLQLVKEKDIVYVGEGKNHPGLFKKVLFIKNKNFHKLRTDIDYQNSDNKFESRIRYRQPLQKSKLILDKDGVFMVFENMQSAINKRISRINEGDVLCFKNEELLGSGVID